MNTSSKSAASILVVEDDGLIALHNQQLLIKYGYLVPDMFAYGEEVLDYLENGALPDLILMDIGLAGNLDGIETARQVIERHRIPVIFLTSYSDTNRIARAGEISPYGYIVKPVVEGDLILQIREALGQPLVR